MRGDSKGKCMAAKGLIHAKLDAARKDLLDLTGRNRLLNTPRGNVRSSRLEIVNECSQEVFNRLVRDRKTMSFLPAPEPRRGRWSPILPQKLRPLPPAPDPRPFPR